jgi:hypothetical protein
VAGRECVPLTGPSSTTFDNLTRTDSIQSNTKRSPYVQYGRLQTPKSLLRISRRDHSMASITKQYNGRGYMHFSAAGFHSWVPGAPRLLVYGNLYATQEEHTLWTSLSAKGVHIHSGRLQSPKEHRCPWGQVYPLSVSPEGINEGRGRRTPFIDSALVGTGS